MSTLVEVTDTQVVLVTETGGLGLLEIENQSLALVTETEIQVIEVAEQGPPGPAGSGVNLPPINFAYGDAARIIVPAVINKIVLAVNVTIATPFNGVGAQLSIGTLENPALLVDPVQLDLSVSTEFEINPNLKLITPSDIYLTITPGTGATQGAGWIVFETATFN